MRKHQDETSSFTSSSFDFSSTSSFSLPTFGVHVFCMSLVHELRQLREPKT
uniref:Uncharacterized protein n=1 Tax=Anopheles albimanus TaxID=7167 RepID=A0A182FY07_ANOAL